MMPSKTSLKKNFIEISLIVLASFVLAALFQGILSVGDFWSGFFAAALLIILCEFILLLAWRISGRGKALAWMMVVAFLLRLFVGVFLAWGLPQFGYDERPQRAGFVFEDAFRRENHAWALARSDEPLSRAFSDDYETDQYGGMLAMSALVYRIISQDAYRPALISILSAGAMALSIPFMFSALKNKVKGKTTLWAGWILALYPEGVLLGSSQMREPFFILFFTILIWAASLWLLRRKIKAAIAAFILTSAIFFIFSFRVAIPIIGVVLLWVWVVESNKLQKRWIKIAGWGLIALGLIVVLWIFRYWVDAVLHWDTLQTVRRSGQVQFQTGFLPAWLRFPFILVYGLFQPVLPAAFAAPAPWIWRTLGIFRAIGWYTLAPLLLYALIRVWRAASPEEKRWLMVMVLLVWVWIFVASARAGGDQWDNPRYRTVFLPWMAVVAGWGIQCARTSTDHWLKRALMIEGIFLAFFTQWYFSRYYPVIPRLEFWIMIVIIIILSSIIIAVGLIKDHKEAYQQTTSKT